MNFNNYIFSQMHYNTSMSKPLELSYLNLVNELLRVKLIIFITDTCLTAQQFYINKLYNY